MNRLSEIIIQIAKEQGLSMREVGLKAGIEPRILQKIRWRQLWRIQDIDKIGKGLGVDLFERLVGLQTREIQKGSEDVLRREIAQRELDIARLSGESEILKSEIDRQGREIDRLKAIVEAYEKVLKVGEK